MTFINIANIVLMAITAILSLFVVHYIVFGVVGIFAKRKFPKTDEKLKYGLIIPARNEELVVGNLIDSIKKSKYPQDKLQIFVIAHNCTDNTAEICRKAGATVYEYNNPDECTMGYAFRYLFDRIKEDYGIENYDGFFLFNADNIVDEYFFEKMNDAFVAENREHVITSYRNSKNFGSNPISALYGLYFSTGCIFEARGRTALGCSTRVQGTGYVINSNLVKDGWKYVTLTEDWEFTADQLLSDNKVVYCDEAMFYDEQPTSLKVTFRQRLRWQKGHLLVCLTRFKNCVQAIFKSKKKGGGKHKFSLYDLSVNMSPILVTSFFVSLLQFIITAITPIFSGNFDAYKGWLISSGITLAWAYVFSMSTAILLYFLERKRIRKVSLPLKILSCLLFPFFMALSIILELIALFDKNVGWKSIPHSDTTNFDELHDDMDKARGKKKPEDGEEVKDEVAAD
ncbi:MAG: glycosyltransferase family 2 protein [Clostridia bacterium]|nr:glycosyltransferase family 2 protein [Clostridia bacterium]